MDIIFRAWLSDRAAKGIAGKGEAHEQKIKADIQEFKQKVEARFQNMDATFDTMKEVCRILEQRKIPTASTLVSFRC